MSSKEIVDQKMPDWSISIPDIQSGTSDMHAMEIQLVGVKGLKYPLRWTSDGEEQPTVGLFDLCVRLPADQKGTHMSRFVLLLERYLGKDCEALNVKGLKEVHRHMLSSLGAQSGRLSLKMPWFIAKKAPVSQVSGLMEYQVSVVIEGSASDLVTKLTVIVPVTSLCPCSKSVSDYGAHNQRSYVSLTVETKQNIEWKELILLIEAQGSSEVYSLLKRIDEKYLTEYAYRNPKFVEDLVRGVAWSIKDDPRVISFLVEGENLESIHNHSVFARIEG